MAAYFVITLLFGTGIGSAFYLLFASVSRDVRASRWLRAMSC